MIMTSMAERWGTSTSSALTSGPLFNIEYVKPPPPPSMGGSMPRPGAAAGGGYAAATLEDAAGAEWPANGLEPANGLGAGAAEANGFDPPKGFAAAAGATAGGGAEGLDGGGAGAAAATSASSSTISVEPIWIWSPGRTLHLLTRWPLTSVPGSLPRSMSVMSEGEATSMTACMRDASSSSTRRWLRGSFPTFTMS